MRSTRNRVLKIVSALSLFFVFVSGCAQTPKGIPFESSAEEITKKSDFEKNGQYTRAAISCIEALKNNPSDKEMQAAYARCILKMLQFGDSRDDESAIRTTFKNLHQSWNNHQLDEVINLYSDDFQNSDGLGKATIEDIDKELWKMYPNANSNFEIQHLWSDGEKARVIVDSQISGKTKAQHPIKMQYDIAELFELEKTNGNWKIAAQFVLSFSEKYKQGLIDNVSFDLMAPDAALSGKSIRAKIRVIKPTQLKSTFSLSKTEFSYPPGEPIFDWKPFLGSFYSHDFTSSQIGKTEIVLAGFRLIDPRTGAIIGWITEKHHFNVVNDSKALKALLAPGESTVATSSSSNSKALVRTHDKYEIKDSVPINLKANTLAKKAIKDKWALVIGISEFKDPKVPKLQYAAKDARDFFNFLVTRGNFQQNHVRLLTNEKATKRRILTELGTHFLNRVAEPDDLVVIFFSTHGSPREGDPRGNNYIVAYDTAINELFATGIEMQSIVRTLKERIDCKRILLVLDACHSGSTKLGAKGIKRSINFDANTISQGSGQLVICSSLPLEQSWESKRAQNGVFTKNLIKAFERNGTRTKLKSAFSYLYENVKREVKQDRGEPQTPVLKSKWKGDELMMLVPPASPRQPPESIFKSLGPDSSNN